jgi:hypothetical protein
MSGAAVGREYELKDDVLSPHHCTAHPSGHEKNAKARRYLLQGHDHPPANLAPIFHLSP